MAVCIAFALILTTCLLGCKSALQPKSAHNDLLLKAMNYSIAEEVVVPLVLGNLVTDLGLTEFMLSVDVDKPSPRNTSKQTLSIDLIANAGQVTSDDLLAPGLPQIQIFPSNQWGWKYFRVRHKSLLTQELILTKSIDRDQMCQLVEDRNSESTDSCTCYPRPCPVTDDEYSYCEFTLTVAVYPLQPGMPIYAIRILLKDINDNAPTFQPTSSYVLSFKENDKPGTSRQLPIATDPDMCSAGDVQYSLRPQSETDQSAVYYFRLHSTNVGKETAKLSLVLIRPLDREHQDQYGLYVLASDRAITRKRRTSTLTLLVLVEDANDCRPEFVMPETMQSRKHLKDYPGGKRKCLSINETATTFQHQPIIIKIPENAPIGYLVKQIVAEDGDAGVNGKVQYSLGPRTNPVTKRLFTLDSSTGELRVSGQLDRENTPLPNGFHRITVIASDQGNPPRSSTLRFLIYLMDTNDNRPQIRLIGEKQALVSESLTEETTRRSRALWHLQPVFSQWVNPLPESWQSMNDSVELVGRQNPGAVLASIVVDDLDMGENGTVSCRIEGQLIALHENADRVGQKLQATTKSVVKLKQLLMYQDQSMNSTDGNTLAVKRVIRARRQVSPDEEKTFAWNVTQEKSYTLESVITLDPETISDIFARIVCEDGGRVPLFSERTLRIRLATTRSCPIWFEKIILINENISGCERPVETTTSGSAPGFLADRGGSTEVNRFSTSRFIQLLSTEFDNSLCLVFITEGVVTGKSLFQVIARSQCLNGFGDGRISYTFSNFTPSGILKNFIIDQFSGIVSLQGPPELSKERDFQIYIEAKPLTSTPGRNSSLPESAKVTVRLKTRPGDNPALEVVSFFKVQGATSDLQVPKILHYEIRESAPIGSVVSVGSTFRCLERKSRRRVNCKIVVNEVDDQGAIRPSKTFALKSLPTKDSIGGAPEFFIVTADTLDREKHDKYVLHLTASRENKQFPQRVVVHVTDDNDNRPIILFPFLHPRRTGGDSSICDPLKGALTGCAVLNISISYQEKPGYPIARIAAQDNDDGENAKLSYFIKKQYTCGKTGVTELDQLGFVQLDYDSGLLILSREISKKEVNCYMLQIAVTDHGRPKPLSSTGLILLHVLDVPPYQRPINDLPEPNPKHARTSPTLDPAVKTGTREDSGSDSAENPPVDRPLEKTEMHKFLLFSLLAVVLIACPTLAGWMLYINRLKLQKLIHRSSLKSVVDQRFGSGFHAENVQSSSAEECLRLCEVQTTSFADPYSREEDEFRQTKLQRPIYTYSKNSDICAHDERRFDISQSDTGGHSQGYSIQLPSRPLTSQRMHSTYPTSPVIFTNLAAEESAFYENQHLERKPNTQTLEEDRGSLELASIVSPTPSFRFKTAEKIKYFRL